MPRLAHLALIAASAAALGGCSVVRLAYENADWLVLREVDAYADLDSAQRERVAAVLAARLEAHRRNELPELIALLAAARAAAADGLDETEIERIYARGRELARDTIARTVPPLVRAVGRIGPAQAEHLAAALESRNEEWREKYLPATREARLARRVERTVERIEHWTGRLGPSQVALVEAERNRMPDSAEAWLAYRMRMQAQLLALLRGGAGEATITAFLVGWWVALEGREPELERTGALIEGGVKRLVARMDATLDERQRAHLLERLDDYIAALETRRAPGPVTRAAAGSGNRPAAGEAGGARSTR